MFPKTYDPESTEGRIYRMWEDGGAFKPGGDASKEPFCIIMPPPNANGELHLGHAMYVVEDILIRWKRMMGHPTLWMPGTDHAGIETQVVFERKLEKEGRSRFDLGPEKFYDEVLRFTRANQKNILHQMRAMGFSADWSKAKFTLDDDVVALVCDTFIALDRDGLVYRGNRVCNWCPRCQTSFADIEIAYEEEDAFLYTLDYGTVRIATTRPETIFADTAVAVHPQDDRYRSVVGKDAVVPLIKKRVPIIADDHVDPQFGTGALKVTPAHDFHDFEIGMRHALPSVSVISKEGRMVGVQDSLEGLVTAEARTRTVRMLEEVGALQGKQPIRHAVAHCERCGSVIEPLPTEQWYVKVDALKQRAKEVIMDGRIRILPERFTKQCLDWLDQMYDWNVSRQIWWGIRMPVYYPLRATPGKRAYLIARMEAEAAAYYGEGNYRAETDTFDTWFSSSQWPHATLATNGLLGRFYSTSVMETGRDILFKWVARMIMLGLYSMKDVPFRTVYLHGLVRDAKGQKMSKSKGNVINPLDMTSRFGADALRIALIIGVTPGNDGSLSVEKVAGYRNFVNKLWNASRFVAMECEKAGVDPCSVSTLRQAPAFAKATAGKQGDTLADRAVLSALQGLIQDVTEGLEKYRLSEVGERLYSFVWDEFCDWYLEFSKGGANVVVLVHVLRTLLRLLHPYCPFVTEELWGTFKPKGAGLLITEAWPEADDALRDPMAEQNLSAVIDVVTAVRKIRADYGVEAGKDVDAVIVSEKWQRVLSEQQISIERLGHCRVKVKASSLDKLGSKGVASAILQDVAIHVSLEGAIDYAKERARLEKEQAELQDVSAALSARLADVTFLARAPAAVKDSEKERLAAAEARIRKINDILQNL